ncbi:MAG: D-aminoacylase [Woeseiaceae bacterium]
MQIRTAKVLALLLTLLLGACGGKDPDYDIILRGGTIYDGLGNDPVVADLAISGDTIAAIGDLSEFTAELAYDVRGKAVAPGFINMLSWATESLLVDGRGMSDIVQGVTLEVMGEGMSMGPLNAHMKTEMMARQGDIRFDVTWTSLGEYLDTLVAKGVSPNVASYVGATTLRIHEIGYEDRPGTPEEIARMQDLVRVAMREGALGVGSSLIYAPASFSTTEELIALVAAAAEYGGGYISHIRSEGNRLEEGVLELIKIASVTGAPAEIYHLKAAGKSNWHKLDNVIDMIETARAAGLDISADVYTYPAGATGLDASMPLWVQEGGHDAWVERLKNPDVRRRVIEEMQQPTDEWENFFVQAGPENIILLEFRNAELKPLTGKTLLEAAQERGTTPAETAIDLVIEDDSRVGAAYVLMSEDNVRKKLAKEWISFGSDAAAIPSEGAFLLSNPHPRAYGNFARVLGKYVREEGLLTLQEAIRRMTSLPAYNINVQNRGQLTEGYFADVVVFDPGLVEDHSTFEDPHRYSTGMDHVFVNGTHVLKWGEHTGAKPGRVVRGPGWSGWPENQATDEF